jgi:hypothetical protein
MQLFSSHYHPFTSSTARDAASAKTAVVPDQRVALYSDFQFKIFAVLWAIAALFHMAHSSVFDTELNFALLTVAAFYVIFKPSLISFITFIALQVFDAVYRMPFTTNHWLFTALVNVTILQALVYLAVKRQSFHIASADLLGAFLYAVRIEVIILYFFTTFHKLNSGFFSPEVSCATELLEAQRLDWLIPSIPDIFAFNAYFTIAVEVLIPLLLCFKRSRNAGIMIGLFFHGILAYSTYNAFYDFSSMIFAVLFLFCALDFSNMIWEIKKKMRTGFNSVITSFGKKKLVFIATGVLMATVVLYFFNQKLDNFKAVHLYFFWTFYSVLFVFAFVWFVFFHKETLKKQPSLRLVHWSLLAVPTVVVLNGLSPYLGLKTDNSYAMFSNLRTEGGVSNHFIVPADLQVFDFQKDVVEVVSSTDYGFQELANEKKSLVLFEFRRLVNNRKPERIEYFLNGEKKTFNASDSASVSALGKNPYVLSKLMHFRAFSEKDPQPCRH